MNSSSTVRPARPSDATAIELLYRQLVDQPTVCVLAARIQAISEDARTSLLVCDIEGVAKATVLVSLCSDVMYNDQPFAVVENLVVDVAHRNQGLGEALLQHVEEFCTSSDCSKIMLLSSSIRVDAHRFFEHLGFRSDTKRGFVKYRRQFARVQ